MGVGAGHVRCRRKKSSRSPDEFLLRLSSVIVSFGLLLHDCILCYKLSSL